MAKKKKRKETKQTPSYSIELKGILLILIAIIGCCPFGIVANLIKGFAGFLVGVWYVVLLIAVGVCGVYMMVKREKPDFLTSKLIGLYVLTVGILILSHTGYVQKLSAQGITDFAIIEETINNLMGFINGQVDLQGGGIIGGLLAILCVDLLTLDGTRVVCIALIILISIFINKIPSGLKIYFIDVGQGDSTLIVTPLNKTILIDGGGNENSNVGKNILLPYLLDRRIRKLDYVFISHFDTDHVRWNIIFNGTYKNQAYYYY